MSAVDHGRGHLQIGTGHGKQRLGFGTTLKFENIKHGAVSFHNESIPS